MRQGCGRGRAANAWMAQAGRRTRVMIRDSRRGVCQQDADPRDGQVFAVHGAGFDMLATMPVEAPMTPGWPARRAPRIVRGIVLLASMLGAAGSAATAADDLGIPGGHATHQLAVLKLV